jgi:repressor of nif and glnA expression
MEREIPSISLDSQFDALRHVARRRVLFELLAATADDDLPVRMDEIERTAAERPFQVSMRHVHLPKLEENGLVDSSGSVDAVTTGPRFDEIRPLLELLDENRDRLPNDWE